MVSELAVAEPVEGTKVISTSSMTTHLATKVIPKVRDDKLNDRLVAEPVEAQSGAWDTP